MFKSGRFQFVTVAEISAAAAAELLNHPQNEGYIPVVRRVGGGFGKACRLPKAIVALDLDGYYIVVRDREVASEVIGLTIKEVPPSLV